ncbi:MAG: PD-(D/E)XK nuclease family protein [Anaerolineaceae bacterium]|nr:PD-(D/E)XK nuclease family protein [Anaerolineaceae bacterium]
MNNLPEHLSYSSISTYLLCPKSWKYRYIDKIPSLPSEALAFGGAFHETIEDFLRFRGDLEEIWEEKWQEKVSVSEIQFDQGSVQSLFEDGLRLLSNKEIFEGLSSIEVMKIDGNPLIETKVSLNIPNVEVPIIGYIDIIEDDGIPADFKTSHSSWTTQKAANEIQPLFYLYALEQSVFELSDYTFTHHIFVKTKMPKYQKIRTTFDPRQFDWLARLIQNVWHSINQKSFFENPNTWKCSSKYCDYWSICRGKFESSF